MIKRIMRSAVTIDDTATLYDVLTKMIKDKTNNLLVIDKNGKLVGMVNSGHLIAEVVPDYLEEDEIASHFASEEIFIEDVHKAKNAAVTKFMIKDPNCAKLDTSTMELAVLSMSNNMQLRVPVVDEDNKPIGIVTRTEIKRLIGDVLGIESFPEE